jgi:hypothetical protein
MWRLDSRKRRYSKSPVWIRRARKERGARVIYLFSGEDLPVFLLAVFAKNEKANLSAAERNVLGKMVGAMVQNYRRQK